VPAILRSMADSGSGADRFDALVRLAIDAIPSPFVERLGSVAIVVEEEPTPDQLASARSAGLFGLYQGVPRTVFGVDNFAIPSKITIFRGPLERANPNHASLAEAIADVVRHEVAHHLGISDARLRELQTSSPATKR
jgi:predicted Zn-dependent protease with MMP-like domain